MTIILVAGQSKELNIALTPLKPPLDIDLGLIIDARVLPICPGASINIVATIHNKTAYEQSYNSTYYVNGVVTCHSTYEAIAPNATLQGICTYTVPAIGTYNVKVVVDGFEATTSFEAVAVPLGEPNMSIPSNIVTEDIIVGQSSYCSTFVRNIGTGEGDISCAWYLDNVYKETDSAHLVPGANAQFTLTTPVTTTGMHTVRAQFAWDGHTETRTGSFTAEAPPGPPGVGTVYGYVFQGKAPGLLPVPLGATLSVEGIGIPLGIAPKTAKYPNVPGYYEISLDAGRSWDFWCEAPDYRSMLWPITPRANERIYRSFGLTPL